jgi:hypothetical protein
MGTRVNQLNYHLSISLKDDQHIDHDTSHIRSQAHLTLTRCISLFRNQHSKTSQGETTTITRICQFLDLQTVAS